MRRVYSVSRYWPPILSARSSTATSRRSSQHESSWTTRGCRLIGTSSGGPSASPEASALSSQRIVRPYLAPFSLFILARSPEIRPLTQRLPYHQNPRTRLVRFRSPHSRTDSSLAVQCQLRYTTKLRKSRVNSHYRNDKNTSNISVLSRGGEGGIRTHGTVTRTTVFETVPFDHSGTSP